MKNNSNSHAKKLIAPIIITVIILIYLAGYIVLGLTVNIPLILKIILIAVPAGIDVGMVYVIIERIKEIRSGEEDDLSKY